MCMKNLMTLKLVNNVQKPFVFAFLFLFTFSACTRNVYVVKRLPPGQAKKITGSKSAKPYAPGQVKKRH